VIEKFRTITREEHWQSEAEIILGKKQFSPRFIEGFHTHWVESAHRIRSQVGDDIQLSRMLRRILPKYTGGDLVLYRGENVNRWNEKSIGFCWSTSVEVARMFGRGLNAVDSGGLLLSCNCKADWIISGPNEHSKYLGESEFAVDPQMLSDTDIVEKYEPSH